MSHRYFSVSIIVLFTQITLMALPTVTPTTEFSVWTKAEFTISQVPEAVNPFDPDQIALDAIITAPSGKVMKVPAFWQQPYVRASVNGQEQLTPSGAATWSLRYTPSEAGLYQLELKTTLNGEILKDKVAIEFKVKDETPTGRFGFVKVAEDGRNFKTDDGKLLKLIGENICWDEGHRSYDFDKWMQAMADSGQNFGRLWMAPWWMGFEHDKDSLTNFPQESAFHLDHIMQKAEALGMYLMVSQDHHGMYQLIDPIWGGTNSFWSSNNPYSKDFGGPCETPNDFFVSAEAKHIYKKKLRYLVARYGYSQNLLNWQFFNEIDNAFDRAPLDPEAVYSWHEEMADWFAENDPYDHLVTTSLTGSSDRPQIWNIENIDYTMFHSYRDPAPARLLAAVTTSAIERYQKPYMIGEFGTSAFRLNIERDPHMRGFRQGLWGGVLGGSVGTAMTWWWEDIDRQDLYPIYSTIRAVMDEAGWEDGEWSPIDLDQALQPDTIGASIPDSAPFNADLPMMDYDRVTLSGKVAIPNPLAAARASEFLQTYLKPASWRSGNRRLRSTDQDSVDFEIEAHFADNASITLAINSVSTDTTLEVLIDEEQKRVQPLNGSEGDKKNTNEINQSFEVDIPAGKHSIVLTNTGEGWIKFDGIRLNQVQPSEFANGWNYEPEVLALGDQLGSAVLYFVSPHIVYPAGAQHFNPPTVEGFSCTIPNMPAGDYAITWVDPVGRRENQSTVAKAEKGQLKLEGKAFNEDLIAIVKPNN